MNQVELQYRKAIFLDEIISVRIDKIELKPASIIFHQSIHRNFSAQNYPNVDVSDPKVSLLSRAKIVIACVQNETKEHKTANQVHNNTTMASSATPIRPIRVPQQLQSMIEQAILQQGREE